ncbi:hypothetical protein FVE85_4370 [Porphyridium purpureum]|uniref:Uncharacterized protein n=1 Tax=Porphyridium purpureum TaxID=35688 RepID=A0A5J4YH20_PORPP|nr:hypothetical protein FVE85_4370 [Porphyridium purpureum]|eukprot:POR1479..scf270_19
MDGAAGHAGAGQDDGVAKEHAGADEAAQSRVARRAELTLQLEQSLQGVVRAFMHAYASDADSGSGVVDVDRFCLQYFERRVQDKATGSSN